MFSYERLAIERMENVQERSSFDSRIKYGKNNDRCSRLDNQLQVLYYHKKVDVLPTL